MTERLNYVVNQNPISNLQLSAGVVLKQLSPFVEGEPFPTFFVLVHKLFIQ